MLYIIKYANRPNTDTKMALDLSHFKIRLPLAEYNSNTIITLK